MTDKASCSIGYDTKKPSADSLFLFVPRDSASLICLLQNVIYGRMSFSPSIDWLMDELSGTCSSSSEKEKTKRSCVASSFWPDHGSWMKKKPWEQYESEEVVVVGAGMVEIEVVVVVVPVVVAKAVGILEVVVVVVVVVAVVVVVVAVVLVVVVVVVAVVVVVVVMAVQGKNNTRGSSLLFAGGGLGRRHGAPVFVCKEEHHLAVGKLVAGSLTSSCCGGRKFVAS